MERYQVIVAVIVIALACLVWSGIGPAPFAAPAAMT